jgi:hypothetical protein
LAHKYKIAKVALEAVQVAFEDLTNAIGDPSWINEWKKLEAQAQEERGKALLIYNVSSIKGTTFVFGISFRHS